MSYRIVDYKKLPADYVSYLLELSNKETFVISAEEKEGIIKSTNNFVQLKSGELINKSFLVSITLRKEYVSGKLQHLRIGAWDERHTPAQKAELQRLIDCGAIEQYKSLAEQIADDKPEYKLDPVRNTYVAVRAKKEDEDTL